MVLIFYQNGVAKKKRNSNPVKSGQCDQDLMRYGVAIIISNATTQ